MIDAYLNFHNVSTIARSSSYINQSSDTERMRALNLHIKTGDYFRFLTTTLSFIEETLSEHKNASEVVSIQLEAVRATRKDLKYLDEHYVIEPRN